MAKLSVQFHALPDEIGELSKGLSEDPSVQVTRTPTFLGFTLSEAKEGQTPAEFRLANPHALVWQIGQLSNEGLAESWLSAMTNNDVAMRRWRMAAHLLRSSTLTGVTAFNPQTGAEGPVRGHRFTVGAKRAYAEGVPILPVAGNARVRLLG